MRRGAESVAYEAVLLKSLINVSRSSSLLQAAFSAIFFYS